MPLIRELHWISAAPPPEELRCGVKLRYHQPEQPATVKLRENGCAEIVFDQAQRAAAPGQAAVLYRGDAVLEYGGLELTVEAELFYTPGRSYFTPPDGHILQ